jgi:anti-sigma factor RsiW
MTRLECEDVFARLSDYIDGELPADVCAQLGKHIDDCGPCVEFVESLRKARDLCRDFKPAERPSALPGDVRAELRAALERCLKEG